MTIARVFPHPRTRTLAASLAAAVLAAACSSGVPLDEPAGTSSTAQSIHSGAGSSNGIGHSSVPAVQLDNAAAAAQAGPQGYSRIIYFDYDSFTIRAEAQADIEAHARFIRAEPTRRAVLEGHTDERGGREYNLALGQKRAEAVRRALTLLGVNDAQIEAVSFGEEKPATTSAGDAAYAQNRRVEISYR